MNTYDPNVDESIVYLERALEHILAIARSHEPAEAATPERPEDVPVELGEMINVLEAVEPKQPLWTDLMRSAVVLRQAQVSYEIATTDEKVRPTSPRPVEA